ncbi:MAG: tail fiber domain-containing protein, partial [Elusimicrobia bacterium]|nr:tail fiber domain-containing protein [Elusimicrobiota bacterium]
GNVGIGTTSPTEKLYVSGNIYATGSITPGCSRTLKENINELSLAEAIQTLKGLSPVTFNYKAEKVKDLHLGFIAEDVPELVATPDRKGVDPMDIVAVVTKVVQEQQKVIQEQNERIMKLEAALSEKK